ncbi:MAG TPA: hypothetical protein VG146_23140 [Verrucomicrobiae bacterium]|nr:hypothetical protein [Verrucomicrobiae bacterium]
MPLISPQPVSVATNPSNTQQARVISATRRINGNSLQVTCDFEFVGAGVYRHIIDHTQEILRHESELKAGGALEQQLGSINVEGSGKGTIEIEGTIANRVPVITEVRLRFNAHGHPSPVTIDLHDIKFQDGVFRNQNDMIARVNTLTFRRNPGAAKMEITVASVSRKDACNSRMQKLLGSIKGAAANLFIKPVAVEQAGFNAMLNFGQALALESPTFTFPRATNLKGDFAARS